MLKIMLTIIALINSFIFGAYLENIPVNLKQPDGTLLHCYASGDEYYSWLHDEDGYTIIQSETDGFYYFAEKINDRLFTSSFRADSNSGKSQLQKWQRISEEEYKQRRLKFWENANTRDAPTFGTINNINIFIRFADEPEFNTPRSVMDVPFNDPEGPSLIHYYKEVSYDTLEVITHHYPDCDYDTTISYQDQYPRSYYQPYNAQTNPNGYSDWNRTEREHTLLKNAVEFIEEEVPDEMDVDGNNDGYVDNVTFLVYGSPDGWAELLWPHRWSLYSMPVYIHDSLVDSYNFNMATGGYFTVGTLCHEFFHSLGAPDLYHYYNDGPTSAGGWDIMDSSSNTPQYMGAWMKYKYGNWIDCPIIESLGTYELEPLQSPVNNCFQIKSPFSNNEQFVVEYRTKEGIYDVNTPGTVNGMLVYRINLNLTGNADGPPDEVYVYRPNGTTYNNGNLQAAIFSAEVEQTQINDTTNPSSFLYGDEPGGLHLMNIGYPEETIEFTYLTLFINTELVEFNNDDDNDGVLNPGESAMLHFFSNTVGESGSANNVSAVISSEQEWVHFDPEVISFGDLPGDGSPTAEATMISLDEIGEIIPVQFKLEITGEFEFEGETINYADEIQFELDVSLNQAGFPFTATPAVQIWSSPLVADLNNDGEIEIIFGDHSGLLHKVSVAGIEDLSWQFDTGDDVLGALAMADLDLDDEMEIIAASKSKTLFIINADGSTQAAYETGQSYETGQYLTGTPAIGNIDDDPELEVVFGGYHNSGKLFAINSDSSNVEGFPIEINEKIKAGVALADFNNDGEDDIVFGTDDGNIYLYYSDGTVAEGFPFQADGKFWAPLSIFESETTGDMMILGGTTNEKYYCIDKAGQLVFELETEGDVSTSTSFLETAEEPVILFGTKIGYVYALHLDGSFLPGWPQIMGYDISVTPLIADLNNDGTPDFVIGDEGGNITAVNIDGSTLNYFPLNNGFAIKCSPLIVDTDDDGDLELIYGTTENLVSIDYKSLGTTTGYWNIYRGSFQRKGHNLSNTEILSYPIEKPLPETYQLSAAYPNPFNPQTRFDYQIPRLSKVNINIYNVRGQLVTKLLDEIITPGVYEMTWDASIQPSGIYFIQLNFNDQIDTGQNTRLIQKIVLMK